jgi:hypothetical protein
MNTQSIINSVIKHNNKLGTQFYKECIDKLKRCDPIIYNKIPEDKYILESIRVHLIYNNHDIYICDSSLINSVFDKKNITYREFDKINKKSVDNMLHQIDAIEFKSMKGICNNYQFDINTPCLIIIENNNIGNNNSKIIKDNSNKLIKITNKLEIVNLMLGIESIKILGHQDLKRFCNFIDLATELSSDINKSVTMFNRFYEFYNTLETKFKERMILVSGSVLHSIGTTYTSDVDIIYYGENQSKDEIQELETKLKNYNKIQNDCDYYIIFNKSIISREKVGGYFYDWIYEKWPSLVGKDNMVEVMADPEHHFHFMGMKFMSVQLIIERLLLRAAPAAFVDLVMLKKINNYDSDPCFPNLSLRKGHMTIYTDKEIDKKLYTVKNYFKAWHNIDTNINDLKKDIKKCNELPHYIYSKKPDRNQYSSEIIRYHNMSAKHYINKYFKTDKLLDIGAGPLRNIEYYQRIGIKKLVAIEPSSMSIKEGKQYHKDKHLRISLDFIEGFGDELWEGNTTYKDVVRQKPYDSILFKFTIHYMIKNIDIVLKNISNVDKIGTTIIITCLDGNKINEKLNKHNANSVGRYEIIFGDEPLYGVYSFNNNNNTNNNSLKQIMVYFKGVYGVESGSIEYVVDTSLLINKFNSIGYTVLENTNFLDINDPELIRIKNKLNNAQKLVSELHKIIVLKKVTDSKINRYSDQHIKYKKKYMDAKKL